MSAVDLSVTIDRPPHDIFEVLVHVENAATWSRAIEETPVTPGPLRVGSRRRAVVPSFAGRTSVNVMELTEFVQDRHLAMRGVSGFPFPVRVTIDLVPVDRATRLDWHMLMEPRGVLRLADPVMGAVMTRSFRGDLWNLKRMMEAGDL